MPTVKITRRRATLALATLPFAAQASEPGLEIRYVIERAQRQPSGDVDHSDFEGAMLMRSGEQREADVRGEYRVQLAMDESSGVAHIRFSVWDNQRHAQPLIGPASAEVPIGGETEVTLLATDNIHYPIRFSATRRTLP